MNDTSHQLYRQLPAVHEVMDHTSIRRLVDEEGREVVLNWVRSALAGLRQELASGTSESDRTTLMEIVVERVARCVDRAQRTRLGAVINATGVILHTGLGRAGLSQPAKAALAEVSGAGNIEIDLETGNRRHRGYQLQSAWRTLTNAEDSLVVNNNAAATLLTLQALSSGKEVILSRGQLIEIGGSFRLPEIFRLSGAVLREVGTTNRTTLSDYESAITPETAAILHVHPSNYRVVGFSSTPSIDQLVALAHEHNLLAIDDIGSGALVDVTRYGLPDEPTFARSIASGADVVLGSGDKLLGGPQCGILLGRSELIRRMRQHPLARTVRIDKLTLAALAATLDSYLRHAAEQEIPTITLLAVSQDRLLERAHTIVSQAGTCERVDMTIERGVAPVGGGSLPTAELPTAIIALSHADFSVDELARRLRLGSIRLIGRIQHDRLLLDLRSVLPADDSRIALALRLLS